MSDDRIPPVESFDEPDRPLVEALRTGSSSVQDQAIEAIAEVVDDALSRELLRFARDGSHETALRARALIALGPTLQMCWEDEEEDGSLALPPPDASMIEQAIYDHPLSDPVYREVQEALRRLYHDAAQPKLLRRRALEAAVRAPRPWQRDAAMAAWRSDDPEWRITAVFCMGYLVGLRDGGFDDELQEAFESEDPLLRQQAILAAGTGGVERMAGTLLDLAADRHADREDRFAALEALAEMVPDETAPNLIEVLEEITDDPDPEIAEAAEGALEEVVLFRGPLPGDSPADLLAELPDDWDED